jgi:hypothetical protein
MTTPFPFVAGQVLTAAQLNDIQNLPISDKTASYTLIAGDVTKRTIMNNASATTITVNNSIFTVGDVIQVANKGAGACTITAGVGVTINTSGTLALAQYGGGYLLALSASTFTFFNLGGGGVSYGTATGGSSSSITVGGLNYTLLSFTTDANLVVSKAGLFDVLMFGGGAGGGSSTGSGVAGGGGGAGAFTQSTVYLDAATYAIDIGAGGTGGSSGVSPANGLVTSLGTTARSLCAIGGGFGMWFDGIKAPGDGGCGGGSTYNGPAAGKSLAPTVGGFGGGAGDNATNIGAGGGGGVTQAGQARSGTSGGAGGTGYDVGAFISGSLFKGGGGGGGSFGVAGGAGGSGVGGNGGNSSNGVAAAANTGSGGGGTSANSAGSGGAGGSGIVYVRFKV